MVIMIGRAREASAKVLFAVQCGWKVSTRHASVSTSIAYGVEVDTDGKIIGI